MPADRPANEAARLEALRSYHVLDTLPEASYDDITQLASEICGTPIAVVSLVDEDRQWFKSSKGLEVSQTSRDVAFCAHAILEPKLMVVPDARQDARFASNPLVTGALRIRFYAGAPLVTPQGEALGTLCVIDRVPRTLSETQAHSLAALSRQVMAQLELHRLNLQLQDQSWIDDVTGFRNTRFLHRCLEEQIGRAEVAGGELSLAFFDLDGFKQVVDAHGHLLGAKALKEVAQAVHRQLGAGDHLVRYGGDEFVVILPGHGREPALAKAERMREAIASTTFLPEQGRGVRLTASFGVASFPSDAADKDALLREADRCLFFSKEGGKDRVSRRGGGTAVDRAS